MKIKQERDIRENPCPTIPELVIIGRTEIEKALPTLEIDSQKGCMDFYLAFKGHKSLFSDNKQYELYSGDYFLTPPGKTHSTGPLPISKCAHYWLRIDLTCKRDFLGSKLYNPIREKLLNLKTCGGHGSDSCMEYIRKVYDGVISKKSDFEDIELQLTLGFFLIKLLESIANAKKRAVHPIIEETLRFMDVHIGEDLAVSDFAQKAGYSTSAFQALFKKEKGISPKEYFLRLKLDLAKKLLSTTDKKITQISSELGFSTSQYFSTTFKRFNADSPQGYRDKNA